MADYSIWIDRIGKEMSLWWRGIVEWNSKIEIIWKESKTREKEMDNREYSNCGYFWVVREDLGIIMILWCLDEIGLFEGIDDYFILSNDISNREDIIKSIL